MITNFIKNKNYQKAYSLVELSISTTIIAILAVGGLTLLSQKNDSDAIKKTQYNMERIELAIRGFARSNGFVPCPARPNRLEEDSDFGVSVPYDTSAQRCTNTVTGAAGGAGAVPVRTLGIADEFSYDGWSRKFTFRVSTRAGIREDFLNQGFFGNLRIVDLNAVSRTHNDALGRDGAAYVIISHGANGSNAAWRRGFDYSANSSENPEQIEGVEGQNTNHLNNIYIQDSRNQEFDDIVTFALKRDMIFERIVPSPIFIDHITCSNARLLSASGRSALNSFSDQNPNYPGHADNIFTAASKVSDLCQNLPSGIVQPVAVPGLVVWLDATDPLAGTQVPNNNSEVDMWINKVNNVDASSNDITTQTSPTYVRSSIRNRPSIVFDGTDSYMTNITPNLAGMDNRPYEIFIVASSNSPTTQTLLSTDSTGQSFALKLNDTSGFSFTSSANGSNDIGSSNQYTNGAAHIFHANVDRSGNSYVRVNGILSNDIESNSFFSSQDRLKIAQSAQQDQNFIGNIGEILIYRRQLSDVQRNQIEKYLSTKWGVRLLNSEESICPEGMSFRVTRNDPIGSCLCPPGKELVRDLVNPSACSNNNTSFGGCATVGTAPDYISEGLTPPSSGSMVQWFDANDCTTITISNDNRVSMWSDKSIASNNAMQNDTNRQPIYTPNSLSGRAMLSFDSTSSQFLSGASPLTAGDDTYTLFAVWRANSAAGQVVWEQSTISPADGQRAALRLRSPGNYGFNGQNNSAATLAQYQTNTPYISALQVDNGTVSLFHNGTLSTGNINPAIANVAAGGFSIASRVGGDQNFDGDIGEIILYEDVLTNVERSRVELYLSNKWGIPIEVDSPDGLQGMLLWLDASERSSLYTNSNCSSGANPSNNDSIGCWRDKSSNNNHLINTGSLNTKPTYSLTALNNRPAVNNFSGSVLSRANFQQLEGDLSIFLVIQPQSDLGAIMHQDWDVGANESGWVLFNGLSILPEPWNFTGNVTWGSHNGSSLAGTNALANNNLDSISDGLPHVVNVNKSGQEVIIRVDGFPSTPRNIASANIQFNGSNDLIFTAAPEQSGSFSQPGNNLMSEVIIFNNSLTSETIEHIENYLATRWGLTIPTYPNEINNLTMWYDANDAFTKFTNSSCVTDFSNFNGDPILCLRDKSSSGLHLTSALTINPSNSIDSSNGKDALHFSNQYNKLLWRTNVVGSSISASNEFTMLAAFRPITTSNSTPDLMRWEWAANQRVGLHTPWSDNVVYFDFGNIVNSAPSGGRIQTPINPVTFNGAWRIITARRTTAGLQSVWNNNNLFLQGTRTAPLNIAQSGFLTVGRNMHMDFGEFIAFDRGLSDAEIDQLEAYLAHKWNIPLQ